MGVEFGDRNYRSAQFTPALAYHPRAPFWDCLSGVVRQLYLHSQYAARPLLMQSFGYNLRDRDAEQAVLRAVVSSSVAPIARARRTIPEETTHVVAWVVAAVHNFHATTVHLELGLSAGVLNDSGTATHSTPEVGASAAAGSILDFSPADQRRLRALYPFTDGAPTYAFPVEVKLSNLDANVPGRARITVSAYAERDGVAVALRPLYVLGVAELRI